ncbi:hypothetical protein FB451DRAFT_1452917 [Mycena latifolia]|nr:hypothetical protein FB451DRAFT_1452917 [Mycena latifolia]
MLCAVAAAFAHIDLQQIHPSFTFRPNAHLHTYRPTAPAGPFSLPPLPCLFFLCFEFVLCTMQMQMHNPTAQDVPPTTHTIGHAERARLVRSMRKVSAVLGETPLIETTGPTPGLLAPSAASTKRGFFYHASASLSSLALPFTKSESHAPATPASDERPALFLRLPDTFTPLPSPLSPTFSPTLMSPTTPPPTVVDHEGRRLRMAKVARTLGESVPPALILSAPTPSAAVKRRRRASTLILPESALEQQVFALGRRGGDRASNGLARSNSFVLVRPETPPPAAGADEPDAQAMSPLGEVHMHPLAPYSPDALLSPAEWLRPASRASSLRSPPASPTIGDANPLSAADTTPRLLAGAPPTYEESHAHGPFASLVAVPSVSPPQRSQSHPQLGPQDDEWTGEWGVGGAPVGSVDMEVVVRGLRGLRVK